MNAKGWTLVTGGAKGLGAEICRTLAKEGRDILIHYNVSHDDAVHIQKECLSLGVAAEIIQGNFSSKESTQRFVEDLQHYSGVNSLINNVGQYFNKPLVDTSIEEWETLAQVNVYAPFMIIKALLPNIKMSKGNIINIGVSGLAAMQAKIVNTAYGASKLNLWLITKSLAKELAPFHVRVNMVSPGQLENSVDVIDTAKLPMGRAGTMAEAARLTAFLLDKDNSYITGQNIEIAGGL